MENMSEREIEIRKAIDELIAEVDEFMRTTDGEMVKLHEELAALLSGKLA